MEKKKSNKLWIPRYTGNRTATINLNHKVVGFDENGILWGENGNCATPYAIVDIPDEWDGIAGEQMVLLLAKNVCHKMGKSPDYPQIRVLKADSRLPLIIKTIKELS